MSGIVLSLAVVIALSACEETKNPSGDDPAPSTSASDTDSSTQSSAGEEPVGPPADITLTKTGGVAGLQETLTVSADGSWVHEVGRKAPEAGSLNEAQLAELTSLIYDPALPEVEPRDDNQQCADFFVHHLTVDATEELAAVELESGPCGESPNTVFIEIVALLTEATPI